MKMCAVYKTKRKEGTYLYVPEKGVFDDVPEALMHQFGDPEFIMLLVLSKRERLAGVEKEKLVQALTEKGYYLQMPPKQKSLLVEHRSALGLPPVPENKD